MKKLVLVLLAFLLLPPAVAAARTAYWWQLGYRPLPRQMPRLPDFDFDAQAFERYQVNLTAYYAVRRNPRGEPVRMYMPLPADDVYQDVFLYRLSPKPTRIITSRYGYKIAEFDFGALPRGAAVAIAYDAEVRVGKISWPIDPAQVGPLSEIPQQIRDDYLVDGPLYRINDPAIAAAAREAVGDETNPLLMMGRIVAFVRGRLQYILDSRKVDAPDVLAMGHGSCTEHTFLMIAMGRHVGLPVRYMAGSYYRPGLFTGKHYDRVAHKIAEVYLPRIGWVPVESTGGGRTRALTRPETIVGLASRPMLYFVHEPEPGLAPIDPRRNIITHRPFDTGTRVRTHRQVTLRWEPVR